MKKYSLIRAVFALMTASAITLSFAACGASSGGSVAQTNSSAAYDAAYEEEIGVEAPSEEAMISENKVNPDTADTALSEGISQTTMPDNLNLKLIWRANVSMETLEFDQSVQQVTDLVNELGGFIESSSSSGGSDAQGNYINKYASLTIRIPSDKLNGFIGSLNDCGTITHQNLSSENISLEYADTETRKEALEAEYDRLIELMAEAENVDAVIAIEARLSEVRLQLDSLSSQLRTYDNLVDYSTIYLDIQEVRNISGAGATTISERIKNGFSNTLYGIKVFFEDLLVFLVVNIPVFVILAVVIIIVLLILKKIRIRKGLKKDKKMDQLPENTEEQNKNDDSEETK